MDTLHTGAANISGRALHLPSFLEQALDFRLGGPILLTLSGLQKITHVLD